MHWEGLSRGGTQGGPPPCPPPKQVKAKQPQIYVLWAQTAPALPGPTFSSIHVWVFSPRVKQSSSSDPSLSSPALAARSSSSSPQHPCGRCVPKDGPPPWEQGIWGGGGAAAALQEGPAPSDRVKGKLF